jgi:small subunit ribosomal protein S4e
MAPKVAKIARKGSEFIARQSRGPHSASSAVPLSLVIRDLLCLADTAHEVKMILNERRAQVDGKVVKDHRLPVGFMDIVSFPSVNKYYRMLYDAKGRLEPHEIDAKDSTFKLCKIVDKTVAPKGKVQLNLHDGKNVFFDKKCAVGDVVKVELPSLKVLSLFPLTEGSVAYVTGGKHAGVTAIVKGMTIGTMMRKPLAVLQKGEKTFETRKDYVFILGIKEPAIKLQ